jgi:hypothetical protein
MTWTDPLTIALLIVAALFALSLTLPPDLIDRIRRRREERQDLPPATPHPWPWEKR